MMGSAVCHEVSTKDRDAWSPGCAPSTQSAGPGPGRGRARGRALESLLARGLASPSSLGAFPRRRGTGRESGAVAGLTASIASTPRGWEQIVTPRAFARQLGKRSPGPGGLTPEAGQQCAREREKCTHTHAPCLLQYFGAMRFVSMTSLCDVLGSRRTKYGGFEVRVDPGVAFLGCTLCPYMGRSPLY